MSIESEIYEWLSVAKGTNEPLSEADYAEAKAEQLVAKGDVPGHEFHGNQWGAAASLSSKVMNAVDGNSKVSVSDVAKEHNAIAKAHDDDAKKYASLASAETDPQKLRALNKAVRLHTAASQAHKDAADSWKSGGTFVSRESVRKTLDALGASKDAASQDERVKKLTSASDSVQTTKNLMSQA